MNTINQDDPHPDSLDKPEKCSAVPRERAFITSSLCRFEVCSHIAECSGDNGTPGGDPKMKGGTRRIDFHGLIPGTLHLACQSHKVLCASCSLDISSTNTSISLSPRGMHNSFDFSNC